MWSVQQITFIQYIYFFLSSNSVSNINKNQSVQNFWRSMNYNVIPGFLLHVYVFLEVELKSNTAILPFILLNVMSTS